MADANADRPVAIGRGLVKSYGPNAVLRGIDLTALPNRTLTLLGPNGAGKTTLLRILANIVRPDEGKAIIDGNDVAKRGELARRVTGAVLHSPMLYGDLTVRENLLFHARMFRVPDRAARVEEVAGLLRVERRLDQRARNLSHGLQRRVSLARALLHRPKLLLLDEPETGLDQAALEALDNVILDYRLGGRAVIMTTHSLSRGVRLGDRVGIMAMGRMVYEEERQNIDPDEVQRICRDLAGTEIGR